MPPPVTRQVTGVTQFTEAVQVLGVVWIAWPCTLKMHGTAVLATAVPVTVTLKLAPLGHVTSTEHTIGSELVPAATVIVVGIGLPFKSTEHGNPTIATLRST